MALLEAQGLSVHFGGLAAVKDVTFGVEPGERVAMIGPNGAGKTTLFNLLTGQLKPSAGKVFFKGQDITNHSVFSRTHLGMARSFQVTSLFPNETVLVNVLISRQGTQKMSVRHRQVPHEGQGASRRGTALAGVRGHVGPQGRDRELPGLRAAAPAGDGPVSCQRA